jgi:hypothetical protein
MRGNKWALAAAVGLATTALVGGAALATLQPVTGEPSAAVEPPAGAALSDNDRSSSKLKAALDALVAKGTITQAQEDAVLQAVKDAEASAKAKAPVRPVGPSVRSFIGDLAKAASAYLGLTEKDLVTQLRAGKSIADIANGLAAQGKNAAGLEALLTKTANDKLDLAVGAKTLTADQAAALKPKIAAEIKAFIERAHTKPAPRPAAPVKPAAPKP